MGTPSGSGGGGRSPDPQPSSGSPEDPADFMEAVYPSVGDDLDGLGEEAVASKGEVCDLPLEASGSEARSAPGTSSPPAPGTPLHPSSSPTRDPPGGIQAPASPHHHAAGEVRTRPSLEPLDDATSEGLSIAPTGEEGSAVPTAGTRAAKETSASAPEGAGVGDELAGGVGATGGTQITPQAEGDEGGRGTGQEEGASAGAEGADGEGPQGEGAAAEVAAQGSAGHSGHEEAGPSTSQGGGASVAGEEHVREDDTSPAWRARDKHFFVLSNAGKPVYAHHGDEDLLAGFMAVIQAIVSTVEDGGDAIRHVRAGAHTVVFEMRGPLYLVAVASTGETVEFLQQQLDLLHAQMICILTRAVEKAFARRSTFDMRGLMGGTRPVLQSLVHSFTWDPAVLLGAFSPLPLPQAVRKASTGVLRAAVAEVLGSQAPSALLYGVLLARSHVALLVGPRRDPIEPRDLLLLSNFVRANDSFRMSETFSPICLPEYNPDCFLYAYVGYLEEDVCLILLSPSNDSFFSLAEVRAKVEASLRRAEALGAMATSLARGGLRIDELPRSAGGGRVGETALWHFLYKGTSLQQYLAPAFSAPLHGEREQLKLMRSYQRLYALVHSQKEPHRVHLRVGDDYVLLACVAQDFELYAAFDPLVEQASAVAICNKLCAWVKKEEGRLFCLVA